MWLRGVSPGSDTRLCPEILENINGFLAMNAAWLALRTAIIGGFQEDETRRCRCGNNLRALPLLTAEAPQ
jgi:hypothetical protein